MPNKPIRIPPDAMPRDHQLPPRPSDLPVGWQNTITPSSSLSTVHCSLSTNQRWADKVQGPPEPDAP
jgi:hypothetical protein